MHAELLKTNLKCVINFSFKTKQNIFVICIHKEFLLKHDMYSLEIPLLQNHTENNWGDRKN